MGDTISESDNQQLLRTVEMFEAITGSQSDDYQSLEILKEAYSKLNRREDFLRTSKKLAAAYVSLGQISQGILEYEGILQENPQDADALKVLQDFEARNAKLHEVVESKAPATVVDSKPIPPVPARRAGTGVPPSTDWIAKACEGDRALANVLVAEKIISAQSVEPLLKRLKADRAGNTQKGLPMNLLQLLADEQAAQLVDVLGAVQHKSNLPYIPLGYYDVDRDVAVKLPKEVACNFCIVPFDTISRSVLIATANPFDVAGQEIIKSYITQHIFWYVSPPADIVTAIQRVHGFDQKKNTPAANKS